VLQCVAVYCSVLQCVAVYCSVLPYHEDNEILVLHHTATHCNMLQHAATHCNTHCSTRHLYDTATHRVLQCVLQRVAACCSMLQCVRICGTNCSTSCGMHVCCSVLQCVAMCCSVLQCVAVCCSSNQFGPHRPRIEFTVVHCSTLQYKKHKLQHTATHCITLLQNRIHLQSYCHTHCKALQHTATHTATCYNTLNQSALE